MLPLPKTPTKAGKADQIEQLKQSLCAKWGLQLPVRDSTWSPSRRHRDPNRLEEKIASVIHFLYHKEGALKFAIDRFEQNAIKVVSEWQFKPHADISVIPTQDPSKSILQADFLRKRNALSNEAIRELTESLLQHLGQIADRVKAGEIFPKADEADNIEIPSVEEHPRTKSEKRPRKQVSLTQYFRNKKVPGASTGSPPLTAQHPSSDEYPDSEMADLLAHSDCMDTSFAIPAAPASNAHRPGPGHVSPEEETFTTPPTTPPPSKDDSVGLGIGLAQHSRETRDFYLHHAELEPVSSRKRPHPDHEAMRPPPARKISREKQTESFDAKYAVATPPPDNYNFMYRSLTSSRSFDNISSVSSSFTSVSPAWTSPNTSFCSESLATSFDSAAEETDTTIRPSQDQSRRGVASGRSLSWSKLDSTGSAQLEKKNKSYGPAPYASSGAMDLDTVSGATLGKDIQDAKQFKIGLKGSNESMSVLPEPGSSILTGSTAEQRLIDRLVSSRPFGMLPGNHAAVPFRQLYEVSRVSMQCDLPHDAISGLLNRVYESYDRLWSALDDAARSAGAQMPERSSSVAWEKAEQNFEGVALSGKLGFREEAGGPVFDFKLNPLKLESSYRLSRKFGSDRFCVMTLPGLGPESLPPHLKTDHTAFRDGIIKWLVDTEHEFLGRKWRAFYTKPDASKRRLKAPRSTFNEAKYRIFFFAENGADFRQEGHEGEQDPRISSHTRMTVEQLIKWFMPFEPNQSQPSLKLFARLALGVSDTIPTVEFRPREILRSDDARADSVLEWRVDVKRSDEKKRNRKPSKSNASVMNDGCSRISKASALAIAHVLGMDHAPSVYQGRIGGAKGIWMVDALDEKPFSNSRNFWIDINDSQLKFENHGKDFIFPDAARVTFEVSDYSRRLVPAALNFQLMPILADRGVPTDVFERLLEEDLTARVGELEVAMDSSLALRKWNQETNSVSGDRTRYGGIEMQGGLPLSRAEKINWFLEHGFDAKTCHYLKKQLWDAIYSYCLRLENKMNIGLGRSTYAFMIADPLAILEEDEIHLGFSTVFRDPKSGFDETMLHDMDVLVARLPAHLPSDIQKVRARFRPELRVYRDVIVFSSKGLTPLASKLSGGDYDGDKAWVCWEPNIVEPFENADVPSFPTLASYGIEKDKTKVSEHMAHTDYMGRFLRQAFNFNLQANMLGTCTVYHEALCYSKNAIDSPQAINIAILLGNLVDSAKGGFIFDESKWATFLKKNRLSRKLPPPAYKDKDRRKPTKHMIDVLVFEVAKNVREEALSKFNKQFKDAPTWDEDLVRIRNEMIQEAKADRALTVVLKNLEADLQSILDFWMINVRTEDDDEEGRPTRKGNTLTFRAVVEKCRADFLTLSPHTDGTVNDKNSPTKPAARGIAQFPTHHTADEVSQRVRQWQHEYASHSCNSSWDLVKASVAFFQHHKRAFVWHIAGTELGEIKAMAKGRGTYRVVTDDIFEAFKLDSKLVDGMKRREVEADRRGVEEDFLEDVDWDDVDPDAF